MTVSPLKLNGTIVDLQGDGVWPEFSKEIKAKLLTPLFDIDFKDINIHLQNGRDATNDKVMTDVYAAMLENRVAVKAPTISPTDEQVEEFDIQKRYKSPNGLIRKHINGAAIFRSPIAIEGMQQNAPKMKDVTMARHAVGDIYQADEFPLTGKGTLKVIFTDEAGEDHVLVTRQQASAGVGRLMTETDSSITDFAHATFREALRQNKGVVLGTKNTISKIYDQRFVDLFKEVYAEHYQADFEAAGIALPYKVEQRDENGKIVRNDEDQPTWVDTPFDNKLTDDLGAKLVMGKLNGAVVAFKNYDGDCQSDTMAGAHISLGMIDSILVSPDGVMLADPAHGTAPDLEKAWHEKSILLANPAAYIYAYAEAIRYKAELNGQPAIQERAELLKKAVRQTIEAGYVTGDLTESMQHEIKNIDNQNVIVERKIELVNGQQMIAKIADKMYCQLNGIYFTPAGSTYDWPGRGH